MPGLLTISGERIELEPKRSYVLGRGSECDIVIEDPTCSRRHAKVVRASQLTIEDLGSRNGTHVDDERITGRTTLEHGSRIRIGATVYLVSVVDEEEGELLDTGTVAHESLLFRGDVNAGLLRALQAPDGGGHLAGQLNTFGLVELLQLLSQTGRSGRLHVALDAGHAEIDVRGGEVHAARFSELEGFQALLMLANRRAGVFWFVETEEAVRRTVHESTNRLLFELCRTLDEKSRV
jgi:pSer/pThr/pTyr-binding forkhead associated (FHA) protein